VLQSTEMKARLKSIQAPRTPHRYEVVAFLTGFAVLVLEITGARLIAPFFGTSTYIWTAIIGVILGSLALGNVIGGRLADKQDPAKTIQRVLLAGSAAILLMASTQENLLRSVATLGLDLRLAAFLSAILLFGLPSVLIGVVYPCLAKLQLKSLELVGQSIGRLEAAGTLGSIGGTFITGYFLLGIFGSRSIVFGVGLLILATSLLAGVRIKSRPAALLLIVSVSLILTSSTASSLIADIDTRYARYQVAEQLYGDELVRTLITDNRGTQSAVSTTRPEQPVFSYIQRFYEIAQQAPSTQNVLLIGGGSYSFPLALSKNFTKEQIKQIDVVEIDGELEQISKDYFFYESSDRVTTYNEDGRTYMNRNKKQYDLIYLDAYTSTSPPFQLTTSEFIQKNKDSITENGAVVANIISRYSGGNDEYLKAIFATYQQQFRHVGVYPANLSNPTNSSANYILIATNTPATAITLQQSIGVAAIPINPNGQILTDDFAPIEKLTY